MNKVDSIDFYWRPGCGFCMSLERGLSSYELPLVTHNIWEDPANAEYVRSQTGGNETVPTVRVGSVVMVNPSAREVLAVVHTEAPHLLPDDFELPEPTRVGRLLNKILGT